MNLCMYISGMSGLSRFQKSKELKLDSLDSVIYLATAPVYISGTTITHAQDQTLPRAQKMGSEQSQNRAEA